MVVAAEQHQVHAAGGRVGQRCAADHPILAIAIRPQAADAEIVRPDFGAGGGVDALGIDLVLLRRQGAGIVAEPGYQELVAGRGVGHAAVVDEIAGVPVWPGRTDAEIVRPDFGPGLGVQQLAEDLGFVEDQRGGVVGANPGDQEAVINAAVGQARGAGEILVAAVGAHAADAEIVAAALGAGVGQQLAEDLHLAIHQRSAVVVGRPDHQPQIVRAVPGCLRGLGVVERAASGAHVADGEVVGSQIGAVVALQPLAVDFELVVGAVVAAPGHQVIVDLFVVGHGRVEGLKVDVAVGAHVADAEIVRPDQVAIAVQQLAKDLVFVIDQRGGIVVAVPDHQVFVTRVVIGHRRAKSPIRRAAIRPHAADAPVVWRQGRAAGGVHQLDVDFELVAVQTAGVIAARPGHQELVVGVAVGHRWGIGLVPRLAAHVADLEIIRADLGVHRHRVSRRSQRGAIHRDARGVGFNNHLRREVAPGGIEDPHLAQRHRRLRRAPGPTALVGAKLAVKAHLAGNHQVLPAQRQRRRDDELLLDLALAGQVLLHQRPAPVGHRQRPVRLRRHRPGLHPGQRLPAARGAGELPAPGLAAALRGESQPLRPELGAEPRLAQPQPARRGQQIGGGG